MSRFIVFGSYVLNVDHIVRIEQEDSSHQRVYMDDGSSLVGKSSLWDLGLKVAGHDHVVAIAPCEDLFAILIRDGHQVESPVYYMAVCADGSVRPLHIMSDKYEFFDQLDSFCGLTDMRRYPPALR